MTPQKTLITICGPSTTGKSHLANLFKNEDYQSVVTTTTRPPRTGEIHGVHYYFVPETEFSKMIANNELIEHVKVGAYSYGLSKESIKRATATSSAVLVMEPIGANEVAKFCEENNIFNHKVYVNNSMDVLTERLINRYKEDKKADDTVYKERLWSLVFLEPENWTKPAYNQQHFYHQVFDTFVSANEKEVYEKICNSINYRLNIVTTSSTKIKF
jgi:guanylate kinase